MGIPSFLGTTQYPCGPYVTTLSLTAPTPSLHQPSGTGRALWEELVQQLLRVRPALMRRWCENRAARLDQQLSDALKTASDVQLSDFAVSGAPETN